MRVSIFRLGARLGNIGGEVVAGERPAAGDSAVVCIAFVLGIMSGEG